TMQQQQRGGGPRDGGQSSRRSSRGAAPSGPRQALPPLQQPLSPLPVPEQEGGPLPPPPPLPLLAPNSVPLWQERLAYWRAKARQLEVERDQLALQSSAALNVSLQLRHLILSCSSLASYGRADMVERALRIMASTAPHTAVVTFTVHATHLVDIVETMHRA